VVILKNSFLQKKENNKMSDKKAKQVDKKIKVSIILPTFNEVKNIIPLMVKIISELKNEKYEIIVVDDDSPDGTAKLVQDFMKRHHQVRLIVRKENKGLVPSIKDGIKASIGEISLWMDADFSMNPALIIKFIEQIDSGADLVVGSRYINGGGMKGADLNGEKIHFFQILKNLNASEDSALSAIISKFGNKFLRFILQIPIHDFSSGFFAGKRATFDYVDIEGNIVDYCMTLPYTAIKKGLKVVEVPMILATRKNGVSKTSSSLFSIVKISFQCFRTVLYLKFLHKL
jgi:dolichol-phosphate mannosyltransferase